MQSDTKEMITSENFKEYEQKVCRLERRAEITYIARIAGIIAANFAFCIVAVSLVRYVMYNSWQGLLLRLLPLFAHPLIAYFVTRLAAMLILKKLYIGKSPTPLEGSDVEKAQKLLLRYNNLDKKLIWDPEETEMGIFVSPAISVIWALIITNKR